MVGLMRIALAVVLRRLKRSGGRRNCFGAASARLARCAILGSATMIVLGAAEVRAAPDCSAGADQIDPRCYGAAGDGAHDDGAALQAAIDAAVASGRPLHLPHAHFVTTRGLVIDYGAGPTQGHEGFLLVSDGATIDGTRAGDANVLWIYCLGGTPTSPKGCFYFHQEGTLYVNAKSANFALVVGAGIGTGGAVDAQNSVVLDQIIVNNSGSGGGAWFNYVLSSKINIVADTAGGWPGLTLGQVQMSTLQVAASSARGAALWVTGLYNFGDVITSPDLEASPICVLADGGSAHDVTLTGGTVNCPTAFIDPAHVVHASGFNLGGDVRGSLTP